MLQGAVSGLEKALKRQQIENCTKKETKHELAKPQLNDKCKILKTKQNSFPASCTDLKGSPKTKNTWTLNGNPRGDNTSRGRCFTRHVRDTSLGGITKKYKCILARQWKRSTSRS